MIKTKGELEKLCKIYENKEFIKDDPVQFPHRYKDKKDIETAGFLASLFAYGKRELFIAVLNRMFEQMGAHPFDFVKNGGSVRDIDYRFSKNVDIEQILVILNKLYTKDKSSLEELFAYGWEKSGTVSLMLQTVVDYFYANVTKEVTAGFYHLIPNPSNKSPMKRMNMFLRWMIRDGEVDFGLWKFMPKSELMIPLDVHVARISRELGLLKRSSNDWRTVEELSAKLREMDKDDPIKYDFALFGYGVNNQKIQKIQKIEKSY